MRISDWSSDVCSSDLLPELAIACLLSRLKSSPQFPPGVAGGRQKRPQRPAGSGGRHPSPGSHRASDGVGAGAQRSEEHTSELQSLMRISYAVFCLKKKITTEHKSVNSQERHIEYNAAN